MDTGPTTRWMRAWLRLGGSYRRVRSSETGSAAHVCWGVFTLVLLVASVQADVAPPVKIRMPQDTPIAQRGRVLAGAFEVEIARGGVIDDIRVDGKGWTLDAVERPALPIVAAAGVLRIPFRATPDDPDQPMTLSFTFEGRTISRTYYIGPQAGARRGKDRSAVQVEAGAPPSGGVQSPSSAAGGAITLRFKGRVVYDRPSSVGDDGNGVGPTTEEGVDAVWFEVVDEDDISDETIFSGFTDRNGYFDTGEFLWDDCDEVGCDDPDLYLRWECDTGVVNVQDATDITEPDYSWSTEAQVIDDFTGSLHDFGTLKPADAADMPVLHIHNSIVRAFRFIRDKSGTGIQLEELDVLYPDGDNAYYVPFYEEIHVGAFRRWHEVAQTHEYGHHFMENHAINETPEYCNEVCDADGDCSHCLWCTETEQVAWSEGWPDWLGDVVTRDYAISYTFSDGTPYAALVERSLETVQMCDEHEFPVFDHPLRTEGFLGALLRDIEDDTQDEHLYENTEFNLIVVERNDCLALGSDEIFAITTGPQPTTLAQFLSIFLQLYPEHTAALYATLRNLPPEENDFFDYLKDLFPPDTQPLGTVQTVTSPTHPLGTGDPSPCITVSWDTPPDDVFGAGGYSLEWSTSPEGVEPDRFSAKIYGSCVSVTAGPYSLGEHYVSIRANEWAIDSSDEWATFGPFTVTDCNSNGRLDVCEVTCTPSSSFPELACFDSDSFCSYPLGCGTAPDCNHNAAPDECDTADGTSEDCNGNGVPDECESISHWGGGNGLWTTPSSWVEGVAPANGNHVCIQDADEVVTVTYAGGTTQVAILACDENFSVAAGAGQSAQLTLAGPSFVRGGLSLLNNNSVLRVDDRLDLDGLFQWTGSNSSSHATLTGAGTTYAQGGMHVLGANSLSLDNHDLVLGGQSVVAAGRIDFAGASTITILPGATHDHQSSRAVIQGFGGTGNMLHNQGTLIKSVSTGNSAINAYFTNSGLVHVQAGTLSLRYPSVNTGAFLADPGTTLGLGQGEFEPTSSIVGEHVDFQAGSTANIRGTYNVSDLTEVHTPVTFASGANIINYGANFGIYTNAATFNAVVGRTIHFETLYIGSVATFNSGDAIVAETMTLVGGGARVDGPSPITVNGLLDWGAGAGFTGPGVVNIHGQMVVGPGGGQKSLYDRTINNAGLTTMNGRFEMLGSAAFNNLPSGVFDILIDGIIIGSGSTTPFNNAGRVVKSFGVGISTIRAPFNNTGTVEVRTGTLQFGYAFVQTAGETILNGGNVATVSSPAPRLNGGRLRGNGSIGDGLNNVGGIVEPGLSAGGMTVTGAYTQAPGGTLHIEIAGLTPITEHDQLIVSGAATLDGTLEVEFLDGFVPSAGDQMEFLVAASRTGYFDRIVSPLPAGVKYSATTAALIVLNSWADLDLDGDVDLRDHALFQQCFGGAGAGLPTRCLPLIDADLDNDGDADLEDYRGVFQPAITGPG